MAAIPFTSKIREILVKTGFTGNLKNMDFSSKMKDKQFCDYFTNYITPDNYVTNEQLTVAVKMKKNKSYVEDEEVLIETLLEYGFTDTVDNISDFDIKIIQKELEEVEDNIVCLDNAKRQINIDLKYFKNETKCLEDKLRTVRCNFENVVSDCISNNGKYNESIIEEIKLYTEFRKQLTSNLSNSKDDVLFFIFKKSPQFVIHVNDFKNKVKKYVNSCHNFSSIPLLSRSTLNTSNVCDSTLCSSESSDSSVKYDLEIGNLPKLSLSFHKLIFQKHLLEAKLQGLRYSLEKLNELMEDPHTLRLDLMEWNLMRLEQKIDFEEDESNVLENYLKMECDNWVKCQIAPVVINYLNSKISLSKTKLIALNDVFNIFNRYNALIDLLWFIIIIEKQLLEEISVNNIRGSINEELDVYIKSKEYLTEILNQPNDELHLPDGLEFDYIKKLIMPSNNNSTALAKDTITAVEQVMNKVNCTQTTFSNSLKQYESNLTEQYQDNCRLQDLISDGPTMKLSVTNSNVRNKLDKIKSRIKSISKQLFNVSTEFNNQKLKLSDDNIKQLNFCWVDYLANHD